MNKGALWFVFGYSFIAALLLDLVAQITRWFALVTGISAGGIFYRFYFWHNDFPLLRFVRIPDSYFINDQITVSNYIISELLTFLAWWLLFIIFLAVVQLFRGYRYKFVWGRSVQVLIIVISILTLVHGGMLFYAARLAGGW